MAQLFSRLFSAPFLFFGGRIQMIFGALLCLAGGWIPINCISWNPWAADSSYVWPMAETRGRWEGRRRGEATVVALCLETSPATMGGCRLQPLAVSAAETRGSGGSRLDPCRQWVCSCLRIFQLWAWNNCPQTLNFVLHFLPRFAPWALQIFS